MFLDAILVVIVVSKIYLWHSKIILPDECCVLVLDGLELSTASCGIAEAMDGQKVEPVQHWH